MKLCCERGGKRRGKLPATSKPYLSPSKPLFNSWRRAIKIYCGLIPTLEACNGISEDDSYFVLEGDRRQEEPLAGAVVEGGEALCDLLEPPLHAHPDTIHSDLEI